MFDWFVVDGSDGSGVSLSGNSMVVLIARVVVVGWKVCWSGVKMGGNPARRPR